MVTRWQDAVENLGRFEGEDGHAYRKLSAAHLEIVARLPAETQERLFDELQDYHLDQRVDAFARTVGTMVERHLHTAPWVKAEASASVLDGTCMCKECPKRQSVNADLFDVLPEGEDRCLDATCFLRKRNAFVELRWRQASEMWPAAVRLTREFRGSKGVLGNTEYVVGKRSQDGAVPGVVVEGADKDLGKVLWIHVAKPAGREEENAEHPTSNTEHRTDDAEGSPVQRPDESPEEKRMAALRLWLMDEAVRRLADAERSVQALSALPLAKQPWAMLALVMIPTDDLVMVDAAEVAREAETDETVQRDTAGHAMGQMADSVEYLIRHAMHFSDGMARNVADLLGMGAALAEWLEANPEGKFASPGPQAADGRRVRR
jgi:hypothetical protein